MGFEELFAAIRNSQKTLQDHPEWEQFKTRKLPQYISFYYTNQDGQEAYWDQAKILKLDLKKLYLIIEGAHGDPLRFEISKLMHCKNAKTGEKIQDFFFDLLRLWKDIYEPEASENGPALPD